VAAACLVGVALLAGGIAWIGQAGSSVRPEQQAAAGPLASQRTGLVRPGGALLFSQPEQVGPAVKLPGGERLAIRRLVWKSLFQWAEVATADGTRGYVLTTDIDLP
jgi:hypothetical protein